MPPLLISLVFDSVPKNLNNLTKSSGLMPIPVSMTSVTNYADASSKSIWTDIDPWKVNLTAFPRRLNNIYLKRFTSEKIFLGTLSLIFNLNASFF